MTNDIKITLTLENAITQKEAARLLGVTPMTLWRWAQAGKIHAVKFGRYRLIPKSEVERLQQARPKP